MTGDFQQYVVDWQQLHRWGIAESGPASEWHCTESTIFRMGTLPVENAGPCAGPADRDNSDCSSMAKYLRRRRAQEALVKKKRELGEVLRLARVGNWLWDVKNDSFIWSEELYRIHGWTPGFPRPFIRDLLSLFTDESWNRLSASMNKALENGTMQDLELELARADGCRIGFVVLAR